MLKWTGERYVPWMEEGEIHYEHLHRYRFGKEFVRGKKVLDLACGEGYGSFMLAEVANKVTGIDIDEITITHASSKYIRQNLEFMKGPITNVPIKGKKIFDVVVCFEALEHVEEHDRLMEEVKRLLKANGIFIVSTPNKYVYADQANYQNPFHLKELYFDDFKGLLSDSFQNVYLYGQKIYPSSNIFPLQRKSGRSNDFVVEKGDKEFHFLPSEKKSAKYFIAVASDRRLSKNLVLGNSYLLDLSETLFLQKEAQISHLEGMVKEKEAEIVNFTTAISQRDSRVSELTSALSEKDSNILSLRGALSERDGQIGNLQEAINQKEAQISHLEGVVRERGTVLERLRMDLAERERREKSLQETINERTAEISHLESVMKEKEAVEADLRVSLLEKDGQIGSLQETMNQKTAQITQLEGVVREREAALDCLKKDLAEKETEIRNFNEEVAKRDGRISFLEATVNNKDGEIGNLKDTINQKSTQLSHLDGVVIEKKAEVERLKASQVDKEKEIRDLSEIISHKDAHIVRLESVVGEKEDSLKHIYNSHGWKALLIYYRLRDKILPINTKRRLFAKIIFKMVTSPKGFLMNSNKRNLEKFGYYLGRAEPAIVEQKIENKISGISVTRENNAISEPPPIKMEFQTNISEEGIEDLDFPHYDQPLVSIIIPVWNKWQYTFNCINSILKNTNDVFFEVIVIDNGSSDETPLLLKKVRNIKIVSNSTNIGFVDACNMGANAANGKYILILNNDTQVKTGWLKSMVELAEKDKLIGLVGAKLIYPDGKLQEAGGIVWNDRVNLAWNYGRYDNPNKYEYNYVKEVDYCSAACLLVRKDLFERIGLFDKRFAPAYCEDTDLAFSIRKLGYKVMYQPKAEVIHFEGTTAGVDTSHGFKSYQVANQEKFYDKWKDALEQEHFKNGENVFLAKDRSLKKKSVLVIDHYVPTYDKDSGSLRMFNMLKILCELGHKVIFIGDNLLKLEPYTQELQQGGIEVIYAPFFLSVEDYIRQFGKYFSVVILSRPHIAIKYVDMVKSVCAKARIIYDTVDLAFLRESRRARIENSESVLEEAEKLKSTELYLARNSDITLVVNPTEKKLLLKENPFLNIEILSNIHNITRPRKSFSERKDILFVGGFVHLPNVDAVIFFVKEIFPLLKRKLSNLTFYIAGSNPPKEVLALKSSDIIVTGYVKDLGPYFENCKVFVAPLRYGAGVKGKINQSMSHGLPVVTTSIGSEGIELTDGMDVLIANKPEEFADKVGLLYRDKNLWNKLSQNSLRNIEEYFSFDLAKKKLKELI